MFSSLPAGPALCLEHGCEKTHNDFFNGALSTLGLDPASYGYASIQVCWFVTGRGWFHLLPLLVCFRLKHPICLPVCEYAPL